MAETAFHFSEARLAEQLGLSRDEVREVRQQKLARGVDWKNVRGEILLTEAGVSRIADLNHLKQPNLESCRAVAREDQSNGQGHRHPLRKQMIVVPRMPSNPRIVCAKERPEDPDEAVSLVWVGRNENFCFGDVIEVEPHETQTGVWQCVSEIPRNRRRPIHQ